MKQVMIELAEMQFKWASSRVLVARNQRKGAYVQAILFGSFAPIFFGWFLLGGSWVNIITVALYIVAAVYFLRRARTYHTDQVWKALRDQARKRRALREEMETP